MTTKPAADTPVQLVTKEEAVHAQYDTPGAMYLALVNGVELSPCEAIRTTAACWPDVGFSELVADLVAAGANHWTVRTQVSRQRYAKADA